ncbi:MAG: hypothetical protein EOR08_22490 [Mesorhizobium sp.]|nr:MAG: hypothetical protein EOR08_22490 [Mesorhizobium sp.]
MLEELLPAEELKSWKMGNRAAAPIALIGEVVHCLEDGQPCHQPHRQEGPAGIVVIDCTEPLFQKAPVDRARQLHQRPIHVEHLIEPGPEQVGLAALSELPRSHCPRTPRFVRTMAQAGSNLPESSSIATKSGKREYLFKSKIHTKSAACAPQTTRKRSRFRSRCPPMMR